MARPFPHVKEVASSAQKRAICTVVDISHNIHNTAADVHIYAKTTGKPTVSERARMPFADTAAEKPAETVFLGEKHNDAYINVLRKIEEIQR